VCVCVCGCVCMCLCSGTAADLGVRLWRLSVQLCHSSCFKFLLSVSGVSSVNKTNIPYLTGRRTSDCALGWVRSNCRREEQNFIFTKMSSPVLGPSQPHPQGAHRALSLKLTTDRPLLSRSRMRGALTPHRHTALRRGH
jgi:hypothetical protein